VSPIAVGERLGLITPDKAGCEEMVYDQLKTPRTFAANDRAVRTKLDPDRLAGTRHVLSQPTNEQVSLLARTRKRMLKDRLGGMRA
jgi:hypothetical protein